MDIEKTIKEFNKFVNNAPEGASFDKAKMKKLEESGFIRELSPDEVKQLQIYLKQKNKIC